MKVQSNSFKNGDVLPMEQVLNAHGCVGGNISPDLEWSEVPQNTKSFAIVCHDPDAPKDGGWYHWLVLDIPSNVFSLKKGEVNFKQAMSDFQDVGYGGACPPIGHGLHHYNFYVFSLDVQEIEVKEKEDPRSVMKKIKEHTIDFGLITAVYRRD